MVRTKDVVAHIWLWWMISSLTPVVSNVESSGISRRTALRTRNRPQIPRLSSVHAPVILETIFVLITSVTIPVLVFLAPTLMLVTLETSPVLTMTLETPSANADSRNGLCVEGDFRKDDVTFLDVQTDGVTLPVPGSSSSFSSLLLDHVRINAET